MLNNGDYSCRITTPPGYSDGVVHIGEETMTIKSSSGLREIFFADVMDIRLINYHMFVHTNMDVIEIYWLGKDTESFFENLWNAINRQAEKALFNETPPERKVEADYAYSEVGGPKASGRGRAKIYLYPDGVCIFPHDKGSRRVPLCFATEIIEKGYEITIKLDTNDIYSVARMGSDTTPFVQKLRKFHSESRQKWLKYQNDLEAHLTERLGERLTNYEILSSLPVRMISGLFSPDSDQFYFAAIAERKAAVELIIGESAATYLYEFDCPASEFETSLRHAMEAVNRNREVIYADVETLREKPLYRMAVIRSYHVGFLRSRMVGKIIHNNAWEKNIREFFG